MNLDIGKLNRAIALDAEIAANKKALAPARASLWQTMTDLANEAQQAGIDEFTVDGIGKVRTRFKRRVIIMGGSDKETDQRQAVLAILEANGHGDKIRTYRGMDKRDFDKACEALTPDQLQAMLEAKLIRVELDPEVKVGRATLGKDAGPDETES